MANEMATPVNLNYELGENRKTHESNTWGGNWGAGLLGGIVGFALGGGAGGILGNRGADANTVIGLTNEGLNLHLQDDINETERHLSSTLNQGFGRANDNIANVNLEMCKGFGALTHLTDVGFRDVIHNNDRNACEIKQTILNDGNATRALINDIVTQNLRERLSSAEAALNNANQTAAIIGAIRPYPAPAYFAPNPNAAFDRGFGHKYL